MAAPGPSTKEERASTAPDGRLTKRAGTGKVRRKQNKWKKVYLKSGAQEQLARLLTLQGKRKKTASMKKKRANSKRSPSGQLKSLPDSSSKMAKNWLGSPNQKDLQTEGDLTVTGPSQQTCEKNIDPAVKHSSSSENSDMASTLEASFIDLPSAQLEKSSSENSETSTIEIASDTASVEVLPSENHPDSSHSAERTNVLPKKLDLKSPISNEGVDPAFKFKGVTKTPLTVAKRAKSKRMYRRKEFLKFYLKNNSDGYHQALKKFHHKKMSDSMKQRRASGDVDMNDSVLNKAPLKVVVKQRLSSTGVAESLGPAIEKKDAATPMEQKILNKINCPSRKSDSHNVMSCEIPFESSFEGLPPEKGDTHGEASQEVRGEAAPPSKRDVCYIFALLDREQEETLFKCSPQVKTSSVLEQLAKVIDSISADDDLMLSKKIFPREDCSSQHYQEQRPTFTDRSTSPILFPVNWSGEDSGPSNPSCQAPAGDDVPITSEEENSDDSGMQADLEGKGRLVNATTKVIVSKALLSFTSELKVLTDVSIRLLGWCSGTIKADLDSDSFEDEFEGFLCHCHDKVSILIECLSEMDQRHILNVDQVELHRFWLLHDAVRCLLQAYRYLQSPSARPHLSQKLLSLMITCSKTMLPGATVSLHRWVSLMTMISGISNKLCEARLLCNPCWCHQHFEPLRRDRTCRMCDLKNFYEEVCKAQLSDLRHLKVGSSSTKTAAQQLFPRFCWFLNEVEGLSQEEFMTAYKKHSVVKFSCNEQSSLYPCDEHVSNIACSCFVPSQPQPESASEGNVAHDGNHVHTTLNESSDQQIVPLCVEEDSANSNTGEEAHSSVGGGQNTASSMTSKSSILPQTVEVAVGSSGSSTASNVTADLRPNGSEPQETDIEVVTLNGGSSEDFSLHLDELSSKTGLGSSDDVQLDQTESVDDTVDLQEQSNDLSTKTADSCEQTSEAQSLDDDDTNASLNSVINCLDLNFQKSQSSHESTLLASESSSIVSVPDSQSSILEASPAEEDLMRDVSIGDDDVFAKSHVGHTSMCAQMGSDSPSVDETPSSEETEVKFRKPYSPPPFRMRRTRENAGNGTRRLCRSSPPFSMETTLEDSDSSVEVTTSCGRMLRSRTTSTPRDAEVQKSVPMPEGGGSGVADSTYSNMTNHIQKIKEDCKRRIQEALRPKVVMSSPPPEQLSPPSNTKRARKENSCSETEKKSSNKNVKANDNSSDPPRERVSEAVRQIEMSKQAQPKDATNVGCEQPVTKPKDKRVTFSDILQFKEFGDGPITEYGRTRRMPANFSANILKEKIDSFLESMFTSDSQKSETLIQNRPSQDNLHDIDDCTKPGTATNAEEIKEDKRINAFKQMKEERNSRKRKLSLQNSKTSLTKDIGKQEDRPTRSDFDKLKQVSILDEKYRKSFDSLKKDDKETEASSGQQKFASRIKRTITDMEDDEEIGSSKNAKKTRASPPKLVENEVPLSKFVVEPPKIIKSCLKKTNETGPKIEAKPVKVNEHKSKVKPGNESETPEQDAQIQPELTVESESDSEPKASAKKGRRSSRKMLKEHEECDVKVGVVSSTESRKKIPLNDEPTNKVAEKRKAKKDKKKNLEETVSQSKTGDDEITSNSTNKKKGSKTSKSNSAENDSGRRKRGKGPCQRPDLNISDPEWKNYLGDLKYRFLDNGDSDNLSQ